MKRNMDTIQFESKSELEELLKVVEKYVDAYPKEANNKILKEFYNHIDVMEMVW